MKKPQPNPPSDREGDVRLDRGSRGPNVAEGAVHATQETQAHIDDPTPNDPLPSSAAGSKQQAHLYWSQIEQLKGAAVCIRLYRDDLDRWVTAVNTIKAVASTGAVAGWFAFDAYKLLWGCIIAAAQLLDALKDVFPFAKLHTQAASLTVALELLMISAENDWQKIHIGKIDNISIIERRTKLQKLQLEAETKHFPKGFKPSQKLLSQATEEAKTYFLLTFKTEAGS
jgi:hypothetical protein